MNDEIAGFWTVASELAPGEREILHLSAAGRYVHMAAIQSDPVRLHPTRLWYRSEDGVNFRIKPHPKHHGWPVVIRRLGSHLLIEHSGQMGSCRQLDASGVPAWFLHVLEQANLRMDEVEQEQKEGV